MEVIPVAQLGSHPETARAWGPHGNGCVWWPKPSWGASYSTCAPSRLETGPQTPVPRPGSGPASWHGLDLCSMPAKVLPLLPAALRKVPHSAWLRPPVSEGLGQVTVRSEDAKGRCCCFSLLL